MTPLTQEWIDKAEGDFMTTLRELRARKSPNYDAACFHAQQCAEKYLKARLQEEGIAYPRTHDLTVLLNLILPVAPTWNHLTAHTVLLTVYAVEYRYPGLSANRVEARQAKNACILIRSTVRTHFQLS